MVFYAEVNPAGPTLDHNFMKEDVWKVLKFGNYRGLPDDCHCCSLIDILHEKEEHHWTSGHLCMSLIARQDGAPIAQTEAITFRKVNNISSALVEKDWPFEDAMKVLFIDAGPFELWYKVKYLDVRMEDIVDDSPSSD